MSQIRKYGVVMNFADPNIAEKVRRKLAFIEDSISDEIKNNEKKLFHSDYWVPLKLLATPCLVNLVHHLFRVVCEMIICPLVIIAKLVLYGKLDLKNLYMCLFYVVQIQIVIQTHTYQ